MSAAGARAATVATRIALMATLLGVGVSACRIGTRVDRGDGEAAGEAEAEPPATRDAARSIGVVRPEGAVTSPVFSPAIRAGGFIFLSGAIGTVPGETPTLVEGGVQAQTRQALSNIEHVLAAAGATLRDVVKCTVFLADIADYASVNVAYRERFEAPPPARSAVAGSGLALGARVEIECLALDPAGGR